MVLSHLWAALKNLTGAIEHPPRLMHHVHFPLTQHIYIRELQFKITGGQKILRLITVLISVSHLIS